MVAGQDDAAAGARAAAVRLLARREHSVRELARKLAARGYDEALVAAELGRLQQEGLLSDERFAGEWVRSRENRGYGPLRIARELAEKGIDEACIARQLDPGDERWQRLAAAVARRRFGSRPPGDYPEWARRARFLQGRGFGHGQIRRALGDEHDE